MKCVNPEAMEFAVSVREHIAAAVEPLRNANRSWLARWYHRKAYSEQSESVYVWTRIACALAEQGAVDAYEKAKLLTAYCEAEEICNQLK